MRSPKTAFLLGWWIWTAVFLPAPVFAVPYTVSNTDDAGAGSLRQAIIDAEANAGPDDIVFNGVTGTIELASELPQLTQSLTVSGPGADLLTVDANGNGRIFFIDSATGDQALEISGLTLTGAGTTAVKNGTGGGGDFDTLTVRDCILTGNFGSFGGAINPNGGPTLIANSTISDNVSSGDGGGIRIRAANNAVLVAVTNTTISGNRADADGGGIEVDRGSVALNNVTITNNLADNDADTAGEGGGIFVSNGNVLTMKNTLLADNADTGDEAPDCSGGGTINSDGFNFVGDLTGCVFNDATGDQLDMIFDGTVAVSDVIDTALVENGGSTPTHALVDGSPAIDAGNPAAPGSGGDACEDIDQRGVERPMDGDDDTEARCDIGAFELEAADGMDGGNGNGNGGCSLMPR